jgi:hypothetical protein
LISLGEPDQIEKGKPKSTIQITGELERTSIMLTLVEFDISHRRGEFGTTNFIFIAAFKRVVSGFNRNSTIHPVKLCLGPFNIFSDFLR